MAHQETVLGQQTPSSPQSESDEIKRTILTEDVIGGVSMVDTCLFTANSPNMNNPDFNSTLICGKQTPSSPQYNPGKKRREIDVNGLYSYCMRQALPYRDFRWETPSIIADSDNEQRGFFVEVDLEYPRRTLRRTHGP